VLCNGSTKVRSGLVGFTVSRSASKRTLALVIRLASEPALPEAETRNDHLVCILGTILICIKVVRS
jgi:hypothetical protein